MIIKNYLKYKAAVKIGIFDSGVGGLTVLKAIRKEFKNADIIYLGDTARVPYGNRSKETVIKYSLECSEFLLKKGVDFIVVACNTASSCAIEFIEEKTGLPTIGVVVPGVEEALKVSRTKNIGVIGTRSTIQSGSYQRLLEERGAKVKAKACPLFVPLVEEGLLDGEIVERVIDMYLRDFKNGKIDTLILGCTHYPLLKKKIKEYLRNVNIVDSSEAIARLLKEKIKDEGLGRTELFFTDRSPNLDFLIKTILGKPYNPEIVKL